MRLFIKAALSTAKKPPTFRDLLSPAKAKANPITPLIHVTPISAQPIELEQPASYHRDSLLAYFARLSKHQVSREDLTRKEVVDNAVRLLGCFSELDEDTQTKFICFLAEREMDAHPTIKNAIAAFLANRRNDIPRDYLYLFPSLLPQVIEQGQKDVDFLLHSLKRIKAKQLSPEVERRVEEILLSRELLAEMNSVLLNLPKIELFQHLKEQVFEKYVPRIVARMEFAVPDDLLKLLFVGAQYYSLPPLLTEAVVKRAFEVLDLFTFRELAMTLQVLEGRFLPALILPLAQQIQLKLPKQQRSTESGERIVKTYFLLVEKATRLELPAQELANYKQILGKTVVLAREKAQRMVYDLRAGSIALMAHSLVADYTLERKTAAQLFAKINEVVYSKMATFTQQQLCQVVWAQCKSGCEQQHVVAGIEDQLFRRLELSQQPASAASTIWAFTRHHEMKLQTVDLLLKILAHHCLNLQPTQLFMGYYLLANLGDGVVPKDFLLQTFESRLKAVKEEMEYEELVDCVIAYRRKVKQWMVDYVCERAGGQFRTLSHQELWKTKLLLLAASECSLGTTHIQLLQRIEEVLGSVTS